MEKINCEFSNILRIFILNERWKSKMMLWKDKLLKIYTIMKLKVKLT